MAINYPTKPSLGADVNNFPKTQQAKIKEIIDAVNDLTDGSISTTDLILTGDLTVGDTTNATSKDTGSIITEGGIGVEKDVFTGGKITATTGVVTDTISEKTATSGVTIDGVLMKDSTVSLGDGTVANLSVKIGADSNNGLYGVSDTQLGIAVEGALVVVADTLGLTADSVRNRVALGTAGTNCTAVEYGDGRDITSVITLTNVVLGAPTAGGSSAHGALVYTFPAGAHLHEVTYMSVGLTVGGVTTDTPDVGVGSVIGAGAVAVLGGTATFEDYITGQTATNTAGTATVKTSVATAGALTGISINEVASNKTVHINAADLWNAGVTGNLTATGTITLKWTKLSV